MSFSNTPQETMNRLDAILGMAEDVSILLDKNRLAEIITFVHGLTESEKEEAALARKDIQAYRDIVEDARKKKEVLDEFHAALLSDKEKNDTLFVEQTSTAALRKAQADAALVSVAEEHRKLDERKKALDEKEASFDNTKKEIDNAYSALNARAETLKAGELSLAKRVQELDDYEASLKEMGSTIKKLTQGIA